MPRGFILVLKLTQIPQLRRIDRFATQLTAQPVHPPLQNLLVVYNEGVLQIAAFNEAQCQERLNLPQKTERSRFGDILSVAAQIAQYRTLLANYR